MQRSHLPSLFLLSVLLLNLSSTPSASDRLGRPLVGGYSPIKNLNDPHVIEIARYAVAEYNSETHSSLQFVKVARGQQQVVAGINYKLVIVASDDAGSGQYQAVVYERVWDKYRSLTSFTKISG